MRRFSRILVGAMCWALATGCSDPTTSDDDDDTEVTEYDEPTKSVTVINCRANQVAVFYTTFTTTPDFSTAPKVLLGAGSQGSCGDGTTIELTEDGASYAIRARENYANCAANQGTFEFEPTDCTNFGGDSIYVAGANGEERTWEF